MKFDDWWKSYSKEKNVSIDDLNVKKIAKELFDLQKELPDFLYASYEEGFSDHYNYGGELDTISDSFDESMSKNQVLCPFFKWTSFKQ